MIRRLSTAWKANGGASAVEFAMILPVFVTMVMGTIQMGIVYYQAGTVQFALEEAARQVMVNPDMSSGQIQTSIESKLADLTSQTVTVTYSLDNSGPISVAQVNASFSIQVVIPFVPSFSIPFNAATQIPLLS
ncbi:MAG: TadE/TadG family type IV pilus assembly protein [Micropepsaceae bacterium]